ncbi:MAG TPA: aminotransferase class V-fold PLP-dependent enzyme [Rhizomicrobium sp.]|nr:aminotransferase class V-fold PLP-dependent enzyme [Rhizomicrobium sp.]
MTAKDGFSQVAGRSAWSLHAAAHSHHPWPDASLAAQVQAWDDAARLLDRKWDYVFAQVTPAAQAHVARALNLPDPNTIAFGPNTHSFVVRLLSCFPADKPLRVLTTSSEFMSFARQIARLEEDKRVVVTRIATEPFDTFEARFADAACAEHDLVFFSQVFFDSGFAVRDPAKIVAAVRNPETFVVIDGYHAFMAIPVDISAIAHRAFYLAGGYKYAMAGEGCCFLHCPPGYGPRPRDTGWYAGFEALEGGGAGVGYGKDGSRFLGATFDVTALYRFNAVQDWLVREGQTVASMLEQVRGIERAFLDALGKVKAPISPSMLIIPDETRRGRFLAFRTPRAGEIVEKLFAKDIITDSRGDRLRIGFGIYHTKDDAVRLAEALGSL